MLFQQKKSKTFLSGKKSNFNFQNRGYFGQKKCSVNMLILRSYSVRKKIIHDISEINFRKKWSRQKSHFNFKQKKKKKREGFADSPRRERKWLQRKKSDCAWTCRWLLNPDINKLLHRLVCLRLHSYRTRNCLIIIGYEKYVSWKPK